MSNKPTMLLMVTDARAFRAALDRSGLGERFDIVEAAPGSRPDADVLSRTEVLLAQSAAPGLLAEMPRLRWVQAMTVGVDHWLARKDLSQAHMLTAARGTHRVQMPENILGAIFHVTKHFQAIAANQARSTWARSISAPIAGRTLGILGLGAIGQELARKAAALEMRVIGSKRTPEPLAHIERVLGPDGIDEVLGASDFVVLLLPATAETENLIDARRLARMRRTAYLINFARGSQIVDGDLIEAVKLKTIAGAVLDVFRTEPLPASHPFWTTPGITVLPHIGGLHPERNEMVAGLFAENARRHLEGRPLKEVVDRSRGY
jgi:phosphoglycerate dehydrogenase-like enzyme